jgi:hypothetical protein
MILVGEASQLDGLGLSGGRVAVELGDREALGGDEDVRPRDAVPQRLRGEPEGALHRREGEEVFEQRWLVGHDGAELVVERGELLPGAGERPPARRGEHHRVGAEAGRSVEPGVGDDGARGEARGEAVVALVGAHASRAMARAVPR